MAATLYGAERLTQDMDVPASTDTDNLTRLAAALRELGAFLRVGGLSDNEARELPVVIDARMLAATEISTWRTEGGDLDVLATIGGAQGERHRYDDLEARANQTTVTGVVVRVASLRDIVESKRAAGREKDHEALPELERLLDEPD